MPLAMNARVDTEKFAGSFPCACETNQESMNYNTAIKNKTRSLRFQSERVRSKVID
jgi:hypothetical protein